MMSSQPHTPPAIHAPATAPLGVLVAQHIVLIDDRASEHDSLIEQMRMQRNANAIVTLFGVTDLCAYLDDSNNPKPDIAIVDMHLQDGSGVEVIRLLRTHPRTAPKCAILAVSAFVTPELGDEAAQGGADVILEKPLTPSRIVSALAEVNGFQWQVVRSPYIERTETP